MRKEVPVSDNKASLRGFSEIDEGIYVERNTNTWIKISLLRRLFKLYSADPMDLVFYLKGESESNEEEVIGTRYATRKRYWTYALDHIKKAHAVSGSFSNVNPTKGNKINGYIGINGFKISCIANYDGARVEMLFGKVNKEANKAAYDYLIMHKDEIEQTLKIKLTWTRGNDIKKSKVHCQIDYVNINNETDWLQTAKFHAEWSKKFYDVFVPLLNEL